MKNIYFLITILMVASNAFCYTPPYSYGSGFITPSRFAPIGYTHGGWNSSDRNNCYDGCAEKYITSGNSKVRVHNVGFKNNKPRIIQIER